MASETNTALPAGGMRLRIATLATLTASAAAATLASHADSDTDSSCIRITSRRSDGTVTSRGTIPLAGARTLIFGGESRHGKGDGAGQDRGLNEFLLHFDFPLRNFTSLSE